MNEKTLYEAVRREDVVIFAGAGFSKYAGYPTGGELGQFIFDGLTADEQKRIGNKQFPLEYLTEEIVRLHHGSRDFINETLDNVFTKEPLSSVDHQRVAAIPHFKTIITTNYDTLFEQAFGNAALVIYKEAEIACWKEDQVNILKIHGDISDKTSLILTREDYSNFYQKDYSSPFWATIIQAIATKTILFLGYGYEDPNVWAIFKHVYDYIGEKRKAAYFVGPNADSEKIHFLESKGIHYINHTGTSFLEGLFENIQENIFKDFDNEWVNPETFRKFTQHHHVSVALTNAGNGFKLHSIQGSNGQAMHGNMKFGIGNNSDFPERYRAFFEKGQSEELILDRNELTSFRMDVEGLKLFGEGDLSEISIKKTPKIFLFDMVISSEGFEIRNLVAQVFGGKKSLKIKSKIHTLNFELVIDFTNPKDIDAKWHMEHDPIYRNINEEIEVHQFLKYFFSQKDVSIYLDKDTKIIKRSPTYEEKHIKDAENFLLYLYALKEVEKAFAVRFIDFYNINQESTDDLNWVLKVIRGEKFRKGDTIELTFGELSPEIIDNLEKLKSSEVPMEVTMNSDLVMVLHGQRLPLPGLHIEIPMPEVVNLNALRKGTTKKMKIKSRSGSIYESYRVEPFPVLEE